MTTEQEKVHQMAEKAKETISQKMRRIWWAFLLRGILALALAFCAIFWPQQTIGILTKLLGVYFLIDGVTGLIAAVRSGDKIHSFMPVVVSLAGGLALLFWTAISAKVFLVIVGIWAALQGLGILHSFWQMDRGDDNRGLVAIIGLIVTAVGIAFVVWPETGIVAISWLIAVGAAIVGGLLIYLATRLRTFQQKLAGKRE